METYYFIHYVILTGNTTPNQGGRTSYSTEGLLQTLPKATEQDTHHQCNCVITNECTFYSNQSYLKIRKQNIFWNYHSGDYRVISF